MLIEFERASQKKVAIKIKEDRNGIYEYDNVIHKPNSLYRMEIRKSKR